MVYELGNEQVTDHGGPRNANTNSRLKRYFITLRICQNPVPNSDNLLRLSACLS